MKKIIVFALAVCMGLPCTASAFGITQMGPDTEFADKAGRKLDEDIAYISSVANAYSDRYIVTEEKYADITAIDELYNKLSEPLSLNEIDTGRLDLDTSAVYSDRLKKEMNRFKMFGGLSGCGMMFEPITYFRIYRNIVLVGGYTSYIKSFENSDDAYWQYVCCIENMTREVVGYDTRIEMLDKIRQMYSNMDADSRFKIFLLVDGKVNSVWERGDDE